MDPVLRNFIHQFLCAVTAALIPVLLLTFLWVPFTLGGHPGEERRAEAIVMQRLT